MLQAFSHRDSYRKRNMIFLYKKFSYAIFFEVNLKLTPHLQLNLSSYKIDQKIFSYAS